jgi:cyclic pyranopterin phosphate synthase
MPLSRLAHLYVRLAQGAPRIGADLGDPVAATGRHQGQVAARRAPPCSAPDRPVHELYLPPAPATVRAARRSSRLCCPIEKKPGHQMNTAIYEPPSSRAGAMPHDGLVDALLRPLKDLRLSVIDQCNFRCTYCMPKEVFTRDYPFLDAQSRLSFDEMVMLAKSFVSLGVEKIRITGGEPLLRKDLPRLIEALAALVTPAGKPVEIAMTTNGSLLAAKARALKDAGLQRVTVSLDALDDAVFRAMNDVGFPVASVLDGIEAAQAAGLAPVKVNAVIKKGQNEHQVLPLARHFRHTGVNLRFIEYMDVGGADDWMPGQVVSAAEMRAAIEREFALEPHFSGRVSDTATSFRYADGGGEIGFIASVSAPFCGDCTRARVSADGKLFMCLFANRSVDLRPMLRAGETAQLTQLIASSWRARADRYSELRGARAIAGAGRRYKVVPMSLVGG